MAILVDVIQLYRVDVYFNGPGTFCFEIKNRFQSMLVSRFVWLFVC